MNLLWIKALIFGFVAFGPANALFADFNLLDTGYKTEQPNSKVVFSPPLMAKKQETKKAHLPAGKALKNSQSKQKEPTMQNQDKKPLIYFDVEKYVLKNGLTVLLHQDLRIPQIYHQLVVKVGSKDEVEGKTGLAHLFEHMMFKGTDKYTGEEYEERLEAIGASNNAFTSIFSTISNLW